MSSSGDSNYIQEAKDEAEAGMSDAIAVGQAIVARLRELKDERDVMTKVRPKLVSLQRQLEKDIQEMRGKLEKLDKSDSDGKRREIEAEISEDEEVIKMIELLTSDSLDFTKLTKEQSVEWLKKLERVIDMAKEHWIHRYQLDTDLYRDDKEDKDYRPGQEDEEEEEEDAEGGE